MYDPDERVELLKEYETLVAKLRSPEVLARMIADGRDPEAVLKRVTAAKDTYLAAADECEKAHENQLQAAADVAEVALEVFKALRQVIQEGRILPVPPTG